MVLPFRRYSKQEEKLCNLNDALVFLKTMTGKQLIIRLTDVSVKTEGKETVVSGTTSLVYGKFVKH